MGPRYVAALQLDYRREEQADKRIPRVLDLLRGAPEADLLVLPELWDVGYFAFDHYEQLAHGVLEEPFSGLAQEAKRRGCVIVAGSMLERRGDVLHNTIVAIGGDGNILALYRKVHLFGYRSRETSLLTRGKEIVVTDSSVGRLGLATCFDLRFPSQFRRMREMGADLFVVPAAWPAARKEHWLILVQARAIEQQTPIIGCNGVGNCEGVLLAGESLIVDAKGDLLSQARQSPGWMVAALNHSVTAEWRREFPMADGIGEGGQWG